MTKKCITQFTLPRASMYQKSVLDIRFHVCVIISQHYRTTGEMPQTRDDRYMCNGCLIPSIDQALHRPESGAQYCGPFPNTASFLAKGLYLDQAGSNDPELHFFLDSDHVQLSKVESD